MSITALNIAKAISEAAIETPEEKLALDTIQRKAEAARGIRRQQQQVITTSVPSKDFEVWAGHYESGYSDDENIKFVSAPMTIEEAINEANARMTQPLCFIVHTPTDTRLKVW